MSKDCEKMVEARMLVLRVKSVRGSVEHLPRLGDVDIMCRLRALLTDR